MHASHSTQQLLIMCVRHPLCETHSDGCWGQNDQSMASHPMGLESNSGDGHLASHCSSGGEV